MRRRTETIALLGFLILGGVAAANGATAPANDAKALEITHAMMQAMGGQDAWNRAPFVRYDFKVTIGGKTVVDRAHLWNKQTGDYRLEDKTKSGQPRVTLFNIASQRGSAYVNGQKLEGKAAAEAVKDGYATFINDMYWLSMPWKWLDPGVHLKYLGEKSLGAKKFDVVELSFDHVGLTPGDHYRAYVSPESHLMEHWEYTLQSGQKGAWEWQYTTINAPKLAKNHTDAKGDSINMGDVRILKDVDPAYLQDPGHSLSHLK